MNIDDIDVFLGICCVESNHVKFITEDEARWACTKYQNSFEVLGLKVPKMHIRVHEAGLLKRVINLNY
ncbi:MAG: hypothetical protein EBU93_05815 [Chlamydiae bacterium]|nr:hypothetical protein [Chlamydiota bacterium]